jgi:lipoprotein-anchoring transpeptidase ErfK/SrfK
VHEDTLEYRWVGGELEEVREVLKGFGFGVDRTTHIGDNGYFRTVEGTLIPRKDAGITSNISEFEGMALTDGKPFPLGFVRTRNAFAYTAPKRSKKNRVGKVDRYKPFEVLETVGTGKKVFYRFDNGAWLSSVDVRVARPAPLPKGVAAGEKWIDVDTGEQIVTAYEGEIPVYITMVSSGRFGSPTVKGEYRIWSKIAAIAMDNTDDEKEDDEEEEATDTDSDTAEEEPHLFSLHDVPWTEFFKDSYALHGVYWHDAFGNRRSHGCVNLSPKDAAWFYNWTEPAIPNGFWAVYSTKNYPGTLVRIR